jgi:folate-binding protein YgfZ
LADLSEQYAVLTLVGPESQALLAKLGIGEILEQPQESHALVEIGDYPVRLGVGSGLAIAGYTLIVPKEGAKAIWRQLTEAGAIPMNDRAWEQLRIQQGRPLPDRELTEDYNPLETGLWQAISFDKGCYIGQETIARLNTYKGVKQRLWGIRLSAWVEPGTPVTVGENKIGTLTSCTDTESGPFGLAYIRTKAGGAGLSVQVESASGELVNVPFLTHE